MRSFALLLGLFALTAAPSAGAETPAAVSPATAAPRTPAATSRAADEVTLKNGGLLRGTITELDPDKSLTLIVSGSGAVRTLAWADVDRVTRGESATLAPAPATVTATSREALEPSTQPGVPRIHIATEDPRVQLRRYNWAATTGDARSGATSLAEIVCRAPCDEVIDGRRGEEFFFGGTGVSPSSHFQLFDKQGDLTAEVKPGSRLKRTGGLVSLFIGAGFATGGGLLLADDAAGTGNVSHLGVAGGVALGIGAVALIAGAVLFASGETDHTLAAPPVPAPAAPSASPAVSAPAALSAAAAPPALPPPPLAACKDAEEHDRRAAAASGPAKVQLQKIAAKLHEECAAVQR